MAQSERLMRPKEVSFRQEIDNFQRTLESIRLREQANRLDAGQWAVWWGKYLGLYTQGPAWNKAYKALTETAESPQEGELRAWLVTDKAAGFWVEMLVETRKPEETGSTIEIELVQTHPVGSYGLVLWVEGDGLIHSGMVLDYGPGGREAGSRPVVGGARWWRDAGGGLTWSEFEGTLAKFGGYDGTVEDLIQGVLEPGFYPLMMAPKYSAHSG